VLVFWVVPVEVWLPRIFSFAGDFIGGELGATISTESGGSTKFAYTPGIGINSLFQIRTIEPSSRYDIVKGDI